MAKVKKTKEEREMERIEERSKKAHAGEEKRTLAITEGIDSMRKAIAEAKKGKRKN